MEKHIKIGIGVMVLDNGKILLGHRRADRADTGGIQQPDSWALPGGKQEYDETVLEGARREVWGETGIEISDLQVFGVADDIAPDRHFVTIWVLAHSHAGTPVAKEPQKEDQWCWFNLDSLPDSLYSPSEKFISRYLAANKK